jgi:hypothetical protein
VSLVQKFYNFVEGCIHSEVTLQLDATVSIQFCQTVAIFSADFVQTLVPSKISLKDQFQPVRAKKLHGILRSNLDRARLRSSSCIQI